MILTFQLMTWGVTLSLLAIIYSVLTIGAIKARRESGDYYALPKDKKQLAVIRAHANFAETVPLSLLLLLGLAVLSAKMFIFCVFCALLICSRGLHAYSMMSREHAEKPSYKFRRYAMALNLFIYIASAIYILELIFKLSFF